MNEWQSIESAPKDGTRILVWPFWSNGVGEASWRAMKRIRGRWQSSGGLYPFGVEPTHWMPLPDPPLDQPRVGE